MERKIVTASGLGLALAGLVWVFLADPWDAPEGDPEGDKPATADPEAAADGVEEDASASRSKTRIPKPIRRNVGAGKGNAGEDGAAPVPESDAAPGPTAVEDPTVPVERPPVPQSEAADAINASVLEVLPSVRECVQAWGEAYPKIEGKVELEMLLGADGLSEASIMDHSEVPAGILSCFSATMWEANWPPFEGNLTVHYPFAFSIESGDDTG